MDIMLRKFCQYLKRTQVIRPGKCQHIYLGLSLRSKTDRWGIFEHMSRLSYLDTNRLDSQGDIFWPRD